MSSSGLHATVAMPNEQAEEAKQLWEKQTNPDLSTTQKMLQTINFKLGNFDDENRSFKAIASTPMVDRQGDSIEQSGWVLDNFIKNPVIPWAHLYYELPVARATEIGVVDGNLTMTVQFPEEGIYDFADTVWAMYRNGFMFAFSVGFIPLDYEGNWEDGYNFTKCELLEVSAVPVPANAGALILSQKMGFMDQKQAKQMISKMEAALKNLKDGNDIKKAIKAKVEKEEVSTTEDTNEDKPLTLKNLRDVLKEILNEDETAPEEKGVLRSNLELADKDTKWSKSTAVKNLKAWASDDDGNIDFDKYGKGFMWVDPAQKDKQGGYKLPFADVIDGNPKAVWNAVKAIYGVLEGARGGVDIPADDKAGVLAEVFKYYKKFGEATPDEKDDESKSLTKNDDIVQNNNMTVEKSGAKLSADTKAKIKDVMDGLMQCADDIKAHHKALSDLYNVGADADDNAQNDDPDADNDADGKDKSIEDSKPVAKDAKKVDAEVKLADEESDDGAEQDEDADKADESDEKDESKKVEDKTDAEKDDAEKTDDEESEEESDDESDEESDEEDLVDPDDLSDEDIAKIVAAVQSELDKEDQ